MQQQCDTACMQTDELHTKIITVLSLNHNTAVQYTLRLFGKGRYILLTQHLFSMASNQQSLPIDPHRVGHDNGVGLLVVTLGR